MLKLGALLHIPMVDHIIVAPGTDRYFSFKDHGILNFREPKMETDYKNINIPTLVAAEETVREPEEAFEAEEPELAFVLS